MRELFSALVTSRYLSPLAPIVADSIDFSAYRMYIRNLGQVGFRPCMDRAGRETLIDNDRAFRRNWDDSHDASYPRELIDVAASDASRPAMSPEPKPT